LVFETVNLPFPIPVPAKLAPTTTAQRLGLFIVKEAGAARLFRRDAPQPDAFVGKENGGARQKELAELKNRVESPALEKQNSAAEQAYGGKKNVVVPGESWLEVPHEIEESSTNCQHDADDTGPIKAGVDQGRISRDSRLMPL
jgi:hypothetical protein